VEPGALGQAVRRPRTTRAAAPVGPSSSVLSALLALASLPAAHGSGGAPPSASAASSLTTATTTAAASIGETWAGHQVTLGSRVVPLMGRLETRTDTFVLGRVARHGDRLVVVERPCRVSFREVAGVALELSESAIRALPPVEVTFTRGPGREWRAGPWTSGWDGADHDGDRHPGITIDVRAPLCGGKLHVASTAETRARGVMVEGALEGELRVRIEQRVLGTEGLCLSALAGDERSRLRGSFRYRPVPADTRCGDLERWPRAPD
jgi:hypothetical protein